MRGRISLFLGTAAAIAALMVIAIPGLSAGVDLGVPGRQAVAPATSTAVAPAASSPQAAAAATGTNPYQPPLHGANPHGMGTVGTVDLAPTDTRPLAGDPNAPGYGDAVPNREEVILGRARGEQRADGTYHGHITILALAGNEIVGVDTNPGQSHSGPLDAAQMQLLNPICASSSICLNAVTADSTTTSTGSTNHFQVLGASVGSGTNSLTVGVATSDGNISSNSTCQTSHGGSNVANVSASGGVVANAVQSTSDTKTCNNGTSTAPTATSKVLQLGQNGVPIPDPGCGNGTPNTDTGIPTLAPIVCNANDTNNGQTNIPYNVREALTVFLLQTTPGDTAAAKVTTAASESAAAAPAATTGTTGTTGTTSGTGTTGTTGTTGSTGSTGTTGTSGTTEGEETTGTTGTTGEETTGTTGEETTGDTGTTGTTGTTSEESGESADQQAAEGEASAAAANAQARLAFTGYDVTGAVMLGVLLLAGGLGARRFLGRRTSDAS